MSGFIRSSFVSNHTVDAKRDFGAKGDNSTDDTAALQAAINYAFLNNSSLYIPSGSYVTTSELSVGVPNPDPGSLAHHGGFTIFGAGDPYSDFSTSCGTTIYYQGSPGARSILAVNETAYLGFGLRDMCLHVDRANSLAAASVTSAVVVTGSYNMGNFNFRNLHLEGTTNGFAFNPGSTPQNGEDFIFDNVWGNRVDYFYYNNDETGQTYNHTFINCGGLLQPGGAFFGHNGSGLSIFGFSATCLSQFLMLGSGNRCSNGTLFRQVTTNLNNASVSIYGGRIENLAQIWDAHTVDNYQTRSRVIFDNVQCTMKSYATGGTETNTVGSIIKMGGPDTLMFRGCDFDFQRMTIVDSPTAAGAFTIDPAGAQGYDWLVDFDKCNFNRGTVHPQALITTSSTQNPSNVKFHDCIYTDATWFSDELARFTINREMPTIWNQKDKTANIVFDDPVTVHSSSTSSFNEIRSTSAIKFGTRAYFEMLIGAGATGTNIFGIASASHALTAALGSTANSIAWNSNGAVTLNGVTLLAANTPTALASGTTGFVAIDLVTLQLWVGRSGQNWNNSGTANPATGVGGLSIAALLGYPFYIAAQITTSGSQLQMKPATGTIPAGGFSWWQDVAIVGDAGSGVPGS